MADNRRTQEAIGWLPTPLTDREISLVATLQFARTADIARLFAEAGFDALVFDLEHNTMPGDSVIEISRTAIEHGMVPLVRLPDTSPGPIRQALSSGALGIVVPRIESAAMAREVAAATRFPPAGTRPVPPRLPHFMQRSITQNEAVTALAANCAVVAIIETARGLDVIDEIAAVDGIDVLFVGMSDLSFDLKLAGAKDDPRLWQAVETICAASARHNKLTGIGGIVDPAHFTRAFKLGVRYVSAAHDVTLLATAAVERASRLRAMQVPFRDIPGSG
jgi:2-keto-3-deoxy-L-rhamnonate aldolase RhmA